MLAKMVWIFLARLNREGKGDSSGTASP